MLGIRRGSSCCRQSELRAREPALSKTTAEQLTLRKIWVVVGDGFWRWLLEHGPKGAGGGVSICANQ